MNSVQSKSSIVKENTVIMECSSHHAPEFACGRESHAVSSPPCLRIAGVSVFRLSGR